MSNGESRGLTPAETQKLFPKTEVTIVLQGQVPRWEGKPIFEKEFFETADSEKAAIAAVVRKVKRLARDKTRVRALFVRPLNVLSRADGMYTAFISAALVKIPLPMDFGKAFAELRKGTRMSRTGWNGANQFVYLEDLSTIEQVFEPCFVIHNAQGKRQPGWVPSIGDMLADDWIVLESE
jgi:hypothetical protein